MYRILVVNEKRVLLRVSGTLIKDFWQTDKEQLIGINLIELENEGTFFAEIVKQVIDKGKKISVTRESESGKTVLAVGNPVFDETGAKIRTDCDCVKRYYGDAVIKENSPR